MLICCANSNLNSIDHKAAVFHTFKWGFPRAIRDVTVLHKSRVFKHRLTIPYESKSLIIELRFRIQWHAPLFVWIVMWLASSIHSNIQNWITSCLLLVPLRQYNIRWLQPLLCFGLWVLLWLWRVFLESYLSSSTLCLNPDVDSFVRWYGYYARGIPTFTSVTQPISATWLYLQ